MRKSSNEVLKSLQSHSSQHVFDHQFVSEIQLWSTHQIQHLQAVQQLAVTILEAVSLINDHTAPGDLPQLWAVRQHHLKGCDEGIKLVRSWNQVLL